MYAIVEIAGQQFKVEKDQQIFVHRVEGEEGSTVQFDRVLLVGNGDKVSVGAPAIDGAMVTAKIVEHLKGDKVIVFKKKRRKGYKKRNGHRQYLSKLEIQKIEEKGAKKAASSASEKKEEKPAAKKEEKASTKATETKATEKKATPKKAEAKKEAPKKAAAKKPEAKKEEKAAPKKEENKKDDKKSEE